MLHAQIRSAVRDRLTQMHGPAPQTVLRDEMGLCLGATRVDVAAINGHLTGCEIKGAQDRLTRLPHQVELYCQVLDYAVLVAEPKFAAKAAQHVPDWWGVWEVEEVGGSAQLRILRRGRRNRHTHPLSVAQLLWRDEVYDELVQRDAAAGLVKATRWRLWEALVNAVPAIELGHVVRERLKARREWPGG